MRFTIIFLAITTTAYTVPMNRRSVCGDIAGLNQCGGSYPSDFCCPSSTQCLPVNASVPAVICCPLGADCHILQPTTCDTSAYDASRAPLNQIHIQAMQQNLTTCGSACCPPGYDCQGGNCIATASKSSTATSSSVSNQSTSTRFDTAASATSPAAINATVEAQSAPVSFSGTSFAAGFIPGIAVGVLFVIALLWCLKRSRLAQVQKQTEDMQQYPRKTPTIVSITQPSDDEPHRTEFLRSTSHDVPDNDHSSTTTDSHTEFSRTASTDLRPMLDFDLDMSRPRSPSPAFMHRARSFRFSPQGRLRNKQSMHSLRRHMDTQTITPSIERSDSSKSSGTIKVALPPEQSPWYGPKFVTRASQHPATPTRCSRFLQPPQALASPYTPSRYNDSYLEPPRSARRITTFSSLMEKAGFHRREFEDI